MFDVDFIERSNHAFEVKVDSWPFMPSLDASVCFIGGLILG